MQGLLFHNSDSQFLASATRQKECDHNIHHRWKLDSVLVGGWMVFLPCLLFTWRCLRARKARACGNALELSRSDWLVSPRGRSG